ncbi:MAG: DUF5615 family PIN-like protein [Chloroflexota bacterium]
MANPRLHLDADTSMRALQKALQERGHDVTRTPNEWMPLDASDEIQLLRASANGRILFTFNIRDFQTLAKQFPNHAGILLAAQKSWTLSNLIAALENMLNQTMAEEWRGQVRWLNQWRTP